MIITKHGKQDQFFKCTAKVRGTKVVFFGWSEQHVRRKLSEWLLANAPLSKPRVVERKAPELRLIAGGKYVRGVA